MSNPPRIKNLWKNVDWKSKEEKLAFYNKYFKKSELVKDDVEKAVKGVKDDIIHFIENTREIKEKGKTRPLAMRDVIEMIKEW